jgi:hypothetical protein
VNPALIGKDLLDLKDTDGKFLIHLQFVGIRTMPGWITSGPIPRPENPSEDRVCRQVDNYLVG